LLLQAASWLALAPDLLGARHPSRILLAWENPAELRATGGCIGATTLFTLRRGHLSATFSRPLALPVRGGAGLRGQCPAASATLPPISAANVYLAARVPTMSIQ
jgi:hypothetical protein